MGRFDNNIIIILKHKKRLKCRIRYKRLKSIEIRKELTGEWKQHDLQEGVQFPFKYLPADNHQQACRQL